MRAALTILVSLTVPAPLIADDGGPYTYDSGTSTAATGMGQGGQMMWLQAFDAQGGNDVVEDVALAFGSPFNAPNVQDGLTVTVVLFNDPSNDKNPSDAQLLQAVNTSVQAADTDTFVTVDIPDTAVNGTFFIGAYMDVTANRRPAARDNTVQVPQAAWVVGNTTGNLDLGNLGNNDVFFEMQNAVWLARANCDAKDGSVLYDGLRHTPAGQALLSLDPNGLLLSQVGPSGNDGFDTGMEGFAQCIMSHVVTDPIVLPDTARTEYTLETEFSDFFGVTLTPGPAPDYYTEMRFPVNVNIAEAEVIASALDNVVASQTFINPPPDSVFCAADIAGEELQIRIHDLGGGPGCPTSITLSWSNNHAVLIPGQPVVTADGVRLKVKGLGALGAKKKLRVRAKDTPPTLFKLFKVSLFEVLACAHEKTEVKGDKGKIEVEPEDPDQPEDTGMTLTLLPLESDVSFDHLSDIKLLIPSSVDDADIDFELLIGGGGGGGTGVVSAEMMGRLSGVDGSSLGTLRIHDGAPQGWLELDLDAVLGGGTGSPRTVKVLNGGVVLDEVNGQTGPVALFDAPPTSIGLRTEVYDDLYGGLDLAGLCVAWDSPISIDVGLNTYVADEIVMSYEEPALSIDSFESVDYTVSADVLGFAITDHAHTAEPDLGTRYCEPAVANSSGRPARIYVIGSDVAADNGIKLIATGLPAGQFGYFITSETTGFVQNPGGSDGNLCLSGNITRFTAEIKNSAFPGSFCTTVDLTGIPNGPEAGDTWYYQAWYRDVGGASNFTDALCVEFE